MDFDAAVQTPATDEAMPDQIAPEATEASEDDALSSVYDKLMGGDDAASEAEPEQEAEPAPEAVAEPVEPVPTDIPVALQKHWAKMDPEAREAVVNSQREMSRKLSEMGRVASGLEPIKSVLVKASQEMPALAGMRPDQVAQEVMQLAKISQQFSDKPLETLVGLAKQHNMVDALRQALGGQPQEAGQTAALQNEIRALKQQFSRVADPEYLREQVSAVTQQERVMGDVQTFAQTAEHWADVEDHMPKVIPLVRERLGEGASAKDVLSQAYDLALQIYLPEAKAKAQAADEAAKVPDPERIKAVTKAKSVNVTGRPNGSTRELSEEEALAAVYDRVMRK